MQIFKMKVLANFKVDSIDSTIKESFNDKCIVFSDLGTSYANITDYVQKSVMKNHYNKIKTGGHCY